MQIFNLKLWISLLIGEVLAIENIDHGGSLLDMGEILSVQYNLVVGEEPLEHSEEDYQAIDCGLILPT